MTDKHKRKTKATDIITHNIIFSMGAAIIPVPVVDIATLTSIQAKMLKELCDLYEKPFSKNIAQNLIAAVAGSSVARLSASFIKAVPGIGSIIGGVSSVILSGASTYAIGQVFVQNLEEGKKLEEIDVESAQKLYTKEFEKGKEVVSQLDKESTVAHPANEGGNADNEQNQKMQLIALLKELSGLKEQGIITKEEFEAKKKDLLAQI